MIDLVFIAFTGSASGFGPHGSVANALMQARCVAKSRTIAVQTVTAQIVRATEDPDLGLPGDAGVKLLRLNPALDAQQ
jgi:potassium-transporting ATPase KdpC subunit